MCYSCARTDTAVALGLRSGRVRTSAPGSFSPPAGFRRGTQVGDGSVITLWARSGEASRRLGLLGCSAVPAAGLQQIGGSAKLGWLVHYV